MWPNAFADGRWRKRALLAIPVIAGIVIVYGDALTSSERLASGDNLPVYAPTVQRDALVAFTGEWRADGHRRGLGARPFSPPLCG